MRLRNVLPVLLLAASVLAQQPVSGSGPAPTSQRPRAASNAGKAETPADTVVAVLNGRKFTAEQIRALVAGTPPQARALYTRDPKQFLRDHAYYLMLLDYADKNGLDKMSPYAETLAFYRLFVLSNAALNERMRQIDVTPEEQKSFYEAHKDQFREARVRMIYVPFGDSKSEAEAKTKAETIAKRARTGEDFAKLAKEFSEDSSSAGAEFPVTPASKQPPEHMKKIVLAATSGAVTEPLRHENGYYLFRVESANVLSFDQAKNDIYKEIQNNKFNEWQQQLRSQVSVKFENEAFFQSAGPQ